MVMQESRYRNCDLCGATYKDEHTYMSQLCTPCWYIPDHVPDSQIEKFYRIRYAKAGVEYPEGLVPSEARFH